MARVDPAYSVLQYISPGRNVPLGDVPSARRLQRAYALGLVSYVTVPGDKRQFVALTPEGRLARKQHRPGAK